MAYEIKCVDLDENSDFKDCRCIKLIGISNTSGGTNKYTPAQMYERIKNGEEFYVSNNNQKTDLIAVEREGTKYVRTEPNDTENDNLLKQNSCNVN
ncbi:MAG: DUF3892 domain-containing protein [Nanoarchaeota archaeon]|nr:DUF3892 domain-containing protein [Nanoarchaeota archaeon]